MKLTEVTLKDGKKINVLPGEVEGLRKLGKLQEKKVKEEKSKPQTKELKEEPETKKEEDPVNKKPPMSTARNLKGVKSGN